ncbi:transketolase family protein [Candidatus Synchoanobacter obligatus]|uniref:Transketolase n=1 Tax=Candidatus Synchoanobacter obligatus TaxID=2919597 RepID=A0ABT1L5Z9_9GAMM|nr:transketolase [Candidatus Synchoanobacter obligatus]MCP8352155.1 transketolase [Candidatus Synchoanobacter obligatus]
MCRKERTGRWPINKEQRLADCIRFLAVDAISEAQSGHPGMPLGLADVMTVLYRDVLRHSPNHPSWANRDRVVLSNGHGSMLLYAALYLSGYPWTIEELKTFRQLGSDCAGHPEHDVGKGVEVTTGPLGQGLANAVGMALAAQRGQSLYGQDKINYHTFCFVGDGCLMEGISHEAASLAPKLLQQGLTVIWDDNGISIDGKITPWFENDVLKRFEGYGFHVIKNVDGHNFGDIRRALLEARQAKKPTFIQMKTTIGKGARSVEGTAKSHGQPLTQEAISQMRLDLDWPHAPFVIPDELLQQWDMRAVNYDTTWALPQDEDVADYLLSWLGEQEDRSLSTRVCSSLVQKAVSAKLRMLVAGSADLAASNLTQAAPGLMNEHQPQHAYVAYGVREFAMFAIANGLALSGYLPLVSTFLTFVDYGRNALRMAAMMKQQVIYVLTHDSIGLGEDGPTHQPVEHLLICRATPNVQVWRPCNLQETVAAWLAALRHQGPTVLALSRQSVDVLPSVDDFSAVQQGAYFRKQTDHAVMTLVATGSEVAIAVKVAEVLDKKQVFCNVVSVPCRKADNQNLEQLLVHGRDRCFVIEAGSSMSWYDLAPPQNIFGVDAFGASAKASDLYQHFGLTVPAIVERILFELEQERA